MMAKKRRRRRVEEPTSDESASDAPPTTAAAPVSDGREKSEQEGVVVGRPSQPAADNDEQGTDEEGDSVGSVVMPPLPSELGMEAIRSAQARVCPGHEGNS